MRRSASPRPQQPGSAVYIQSVAGFCCSAGHAAGINSSIGGRPPASRSATRHDESSDNRAATTAPADPAPTTTKSNVSAMSSPHPITHSPERLLAWRLGELVAHAPEHQATNPPMRQGLGRSPRPVVVYAAEKLV